MSNTRTYELVSYGQKYIIKLRLAKYDSNSNLAIHLYYYDDEFQSYAPYSVLTINLENLKDKTTAYIDTNNCPWAEKFIRDNKLGVSLNKSFNSGYCTYPLYKFDMERIKE